MPLTTEQIKNLKEQLSKQISHLSGEQKAKAQTQIDSLSPEALELMLKQSQQKEKTSKKSEKPIFRQIVDKDTPSVIIDQNKKAIAVLDIFPISQGHTIIIPIEAARTSINIPAQAMALAKKIAKRLSTKLKASSVQILTETKFGETIINVLPSYETPLNLSSPRSEAKQEVLEKIAVKLKPIKKKIVEKLKAAPSGQPLKLPRRIP